MDEMCCEQENLGGEGEGNRKNAMPWNETELNKKQTNKQKSEQTARKEGLNKN